MDKVNLFVTFIKEEMYKDTCFGVLLNVAGIFFTALTVFSGIFILGPYMLLVIFLSFIAYTIYKFSNYIKEQDNDEHN